MYRRLALVVAFVTSVFTSSVSAQCFSGPDGLNGPCWQPATLNIPNFPTLTLPATGICWTNCQPQQLCTQVTISTPVFVRCGVYNASIFITDCVGVPQLSGTLVMDYTRTWDEIDPTGMVHQIYRFVVKIDMEGATAGVPNPCLVPSCLPAHPTAFYYGYLDYAQLCAPLNFTEAALVLFHNCDEFIHHQTSAKPGVFHPNRSYAIVAPSTAVNPFLAAIAPPHVGMMTAEAVRNVPQVAGATCIFEDPISNGNVNFAGAGCGCTFSLNPPQLTARRLNGSATCVDPTGAVSTFVSIKSMPAFPWFHDFTTSIGTWTTPVGYPGREHAWVDEVPIFYRDTCSQQAYGEVYYGGSTSEGWPIVPVGGPLTQNFTDLASNTSFKVPGPPPATFMGCVLPTRNLIYFNVP